MKDGYTKEALKSAAWMYKNAPLWEWVENPIWGGIECKLMTHATPEGVQGVTYLMIVFDRAETVYCEYSAFKKYL